MTKAYFTIEVDLPDAATREYFSKVEERLGV